MEASIRFQILVALLNYQYNVTFKQKNINATDYKDSLMNQGNNSLIMLQT
jgi:hypothetical protein